MNGLSQLQPSPEVEMGVGDMRMEDFKALFRLRKGKLQPGTLLRLVIRQVQTKGRMGAYETWDGEAREYWTEMEGDAMALAEKHGIRLQVSDVSYHA